MIGYSEDAYTWWDRRIKICDDVLKPLVDRGFSFDIRDGFLKVEPAPDVSISAELQMQMPDVMLFIAEVGDGKWPLACKRIEQKPLDPAQELCELVSFANDPERVYVSRQ